MMSSMDDSLKLSDPDFITRRKTPTVPLGPTILLISSATNSFLSMLLWTIAPMSVWGMSR